MQIFGDSMEICLNQHKKLKNFPLTHGNLGQIQEEPHNYKMQHMKNLLILLKCNDDSNNNDNTCKI